jgi:ribosome modulation factor
MSQSIYNAGYEAGFEGRDASDNPYSPMDIRFDIWDDGHCDGANEVDIDNDYDDLDGDAESAFDLIGWGCDESYEHYDEC